MTSDQSLENAERPAGDAVNGESLDLKALREARGITLREIYEQTRITVVNLEAIETQKFHLLPSPAYAKTFIRAYADAIGIDSKIVHEAYGRYLQSLHVEKDREKDNGKSRRKGKGERFLIWTVLLTIVAGAVMLALFLQYGSGPDILRSEPAKAPLQKTDAATVEVAKPVVAPVPPGQADPAKPDTKTDGTQVMTGQSPQQTGRDLQPGIPASPGTATGTPVSSESRQTEAPR